MNSILTGLALLALAIQAAPQAVSPSATAAVTEAPAEAPAEAATEDAAPTSTETWHAFSRSANAAYMADVDDIVVEGEITRIRLAIVPLRGEAGDFGHTIDTYEFRCGPKQWRSPVSVEYGPDGDEVGRYPDDSEWLATRDGTVPATLKEIACDGVRANPPTWPAIRAFIEAGRSSY